MTKNKEHKLSKENKSKYYDGLWNVIIRMYYYSTKGVELLNFFRYYLFGLFGLYMALKLTNKMYLLILFLITYPILIILGYIAVHKMAKIIEFLNVEFATHFQRYRVSLQEKTLTVLEKIAGDEDEKN